MKMIDKLEVRVPRVTPLRQQFASLYRELAWEDAQRSTQGLRRRLRASRYYEAVIDLREFGHEVILHSFASLGKSGDHKIEFVETGKMGLSQMVHEIEQIFDIDPQKLAVMRIDLTANVPDIPVSWFLTHCRVQFKRWSADIGQIVYGPEYSEMGMKVVQTLYFGRRPNVIRIYDKVAESAHRYKQLLRNISPDAEIPRFEEVYGCSPSDVLTRVERQLAAGRVPPEVDTVDKLRNAASFNPFDRLKIVAGCEGEPEPYDSRSDVYERGIEIRRMISEQGLQRTRYTLNDQSQGNVDRILKTVANFIPDGGYHLTPEELFQRYQDSVNRQLVA